MTDINPFSTITHIAGGYGLARSLHIVADLGVADALDVTPRSAAELAACVGADAAALGRTLRLLAAHGVFAVENERVTHSPASRLLRSDHPQSMLPFAQMFGLHVFWRTFESMEHAVRTGQPATTSVFPGGFWGYFAERPEEARVFNAAMRAKAGGATAGILTSYDFSEFSSVADIGGGSGHLLQGILETVPSATGVLFDLPHVIDDAASIASERLALQAGDFFKDQLPACDLYLLMEIIHDWGDDESIAILQSVREVAQPGTTVLIIETIVPDDPGPDWSKMLDIHMLTLLGGKQRTRREYADLLERAGFAFEREINTGAGISILEARAT